MGIRAYAGYQIGFRSDSPSCDTSIGRSYAEQIFLELRMLMNGELNPNAKNSLPI